MKFNLLYILTFILLTIGCKPIDKVYSIRINNNSNDTIQLFASYSYPDTSIINSKPYLYIAYPNDYSSIDSDEKWEELLPNNIISIFILSIEDLEKQEWTISYP